MIKIHLPLTKSTSEYSHLRQKALNSHNRLFTTRIWISGARTPDASSKRKLKRSNSEESNT